MQTIFKLLGKNLHMNKIIECEKHGPQQMTYVCQHLVESLRTGVKVGFFWDSENPRGDAWCAACEKVRIREGGNTGDWNEKSGELAQVQILCGACYDRLRELQGF